MDGTTEEGVYVRSKLEDFKDEMLRNPGQSSRSTRRTARGGMRSINVAKNTRQWQVIYWGRDEGTSYPGVMEMAPSSDDTTWSGTEVEMQIRRMPSRGSQRCCPAKVQYI